MVNTSINTRFSVFLILAAFFGEGSANAEEVFGHVELQPRAFFQNPTDSFQRRDSISAAVESKYERSWDSGRQSFSATLFGRLDSADSQRTHADLREFDWIGSFGDLELEVGTSRVFWGVTESQHLVDIINQSDLVESFDGEQKLGQPLLRASLIDYFGDLHLYVMPYFRVRTFPGPRGRLRTIPAVSTRPIYESELEAWHPSAAVRWEKATSMFDIGLNYFYGTSRDPLLLPDEDKLSPHYKLIHQIGLDLQATRDALLVKHESIYRIYNDANSPQPDFLAQTSGVEYTFYSLWGPADIGIIAEYLWASEQNFLTPFDNDIFAGVRFGRNDVEGTQILLGGIVDLDTATTTVNLEASRRLSDELTAAVEARFFRPREEVFLNAFKRDSYVQVQVRYAY